MKAFLALTIAALLLTACSVPGRPREAAVCPPVGLVPGGDRVVMAGGSVFMADARLSCDPPEKGTANVTLTVRLQAQDIKPNTTPSLNAAYFVAVLTDDERVLSRQQFSMTLAADSSPAWQGTDTLDLSLPAANSAAVKTLRVAVGLVPPGQEKP